MLDSVAGLSHTGARHNLRLSIAVGDYDRTQQLLNGSIQIDGVDPIYMTLEPEEIFFRAFRHADFDVCELSLSSFALQTASGNCAYVGIPAFLSRAFRHTAIYVRTDRIKRPTDLIGKRVGMPEYQLTANVWVRALLADDYGVDAGAVIWVQGGIEDPARKEKIKLDLPPEIRIEHAPPGRSLSAMLESGEIDALVAPRAASCFARGAPNIGWLFADPAAAIADYFGRTGIFPIMHVLGIRRELVESFPFLPVAVYKAFEKARAVAMDRLTDVAALRTSLPLSELNVKSVRAFMGSDFWTYGLTEENRMVVDTFLSHHFAQGISSRRLRVDELFHPSTHELTRI